jgi:hypothetical protein
MSLAVDLSCVTGDSPASVVGPSSVTPHRDRSASREARFAKLERRLNERGLSLADVMVLGGSLNRIMVRRAGEHCRWCARCGEDIDPGQPVVRCWVYLGGSPFTGGAERQLAPVCLACTEEDQEYLCEYRRLWRMASRHPERWPRCEECGRPVLLLAGTTFKRLSCSERCAYLAKLAARRAQRIRKIDCADCGATFSARADARYCSPACRQRAHRRRHRKAEPCADHPDLASQVDRREGVGTGSARGRGMTPAPAFACPQPPSLAMIGMWPWRLHLRLSPSSMRAGAGCGES